MKNNYDSDVMNLASLIYLLGYKDYDSENIDIRYIIDELKLLSHDHEVSVATTEFDVYDKMQSIRLTMTDHSSSTITYH